jgi:hypothetical protein
MSPDLTKRTSRSQIMLLEKSEILCSCSRQRDSTWNAEPAFDDDLSYTPKVATSFFNSSWWDDWDWNLLERWIGWSLAWHNLHEDFHLALGSFKTCFQLQGTREGSSTWDDTQVC